MTSQPAPVPPQAGDPQPAVPQPAAPQIEVPPWNPPAGLEPGPLPRRSRGRLWFQYRAQWLYVAPLYAFLGILWVLCLFSDSASPFGDDAGSTIRHWRLTKRQYLMERDGTVADWRGYAAEDLANRCGTAIASELGTRAWARTAVTKKLKNRPHAQPSVLLPVRAYRGLGIHGVAELANAEHWAIVWSSTRDPRKALVLRYLQPIDEAA